MERQDPAGLFQVIHASLLMQASAQLHQPAWLCQTQAQQTPVPPMQLLICAYVNTPSWFCNSVSIRTVDKDVPRKCKDVPRKYIQHKAVKHLSVHY